MKKIEGLDTEEDSELQLLLEEFNKIDKRKTGSIKLTEALKLLKETSKITLVND